MTRQLERTLDRRGMRTRVVLAFSGDEPVDDELERDGFLGRYGPLAEHRRRSLPASDHTFRPIVAQQRPTRCGPGVRLAAGSFTGCRCRTRCAAAGAPCGRRSQPSRGSSSMDEDEGSPRPTPGGPAAPRERPPLVARGAGECVREPDASSRGDGPLVRTADALAGSVLELGCGAGRLTGYLIEVARASTASMSRLDDRVLLPSIPAWHLPRRRHP